MLYNSQNGLKMLRNIIHFFLFSKLNYKDRATFCFYCFHFLHRPVNHSEVFQM